MDFKTQIEQYEHEVDNGTYIMKEGKNPVMLTAAHTMIQLHDDGTYKLDEPLTKAIVKYVTNKVNGNYLIKVQDTKVDSNSDVEDNFKVMLQNIIEKNNIGLLIDIHGASETHDFDVEIGTLNNISADFSTIMELKESFEEHGIKNVVLNNPFKGGGITRYIYGNTSADAVQIEINRKFRDLNNSDNIEKICNSLIDFLYQYLSK